MVQKLLFIAILFGAAQVFAQAPIVIIDATTDTDVTNTQIDVVGSPTDNDIYRYFHVHYDGIGSYDINLKRIELDVTSGTLNSACWGICPADVTEGTYPVWDYGNPPQGVPTIPPLTITSQDTLYDELQCHHKPNNLEGCSLYRYVLYNANSTTDSVYVDVRYIHTNSGVCDLSIEEVNQNNNVQMYPNPTSSNLKFAFDLNHSVSSLQIVDMLGKAVKTINTSKATGVKTVDVSDLNNGFYFVKIMSGTKVIESKKLMIK